MSSHISSRALDDEVSYVVPLSNYGTDGLCRDYTLRRSKWEAEANAGSHEARMDWMKYIGPIEEFGGCNPINGNFSAVALPLTRPDRLRLVAYLLECTGSAHHMFCHRTLVILFGVSPLKKL